MAGDGSEGGIVEKSVGRRIFPDPLPDEAGLDSHAARELL